MSAADPALAPRRSTSLQTGLRPVTACDVPADSVPRHPRRQRSRLSMFLSREKVESEWQAEDEQTDVMPELAIQTSNDEQPDFRPKRSLRRATTITQTLRSGIDELRGLGRRMSLTMRSKNMRQKADNVDMSMEQFLSSKPPISQSNPTREASTRPGTRASMTNFFRSSSVRGPSGLPLNFDTEFTALGLDLPPSSRLQSMNHAVLPDYVFGGNGARAAAAAQNEAREAARTPSLPPYEPRQCPSETQLLRDSESGIGIILDSVRSDSSSMTADLVRRDPTTALMNELMLHVLSYLDATSLIQASSVSSHWRDLALSQLVWKRIFFREYADKSQANGFHLPQAPGLGKKDPRQNYQKLFKIRKMIEKRWEKGEAAAMYLNGHKDSVYCVQFDEQKIITGSRDNTIRVWDAHTYQCLHKLGPPNNPRDRQQVQRPEVNPQGVVPFYKEDFSPPEPTAHGLLKWHQASVLCLQYDDEILVSGSSDFTCLVWSIKAGYQPLFRLVGHTAGVLDVCIDRDRIVTCSKDTTIKIWDRTTGACLKTLRGHRGPVNAVQIRGNLLATASGDGMSKLWRLEDGVCIKEFESRDRGLACVEFSEDGRTIFAGGNDQVIYEYDTVTGTKKRELRGHKDLVRSLHLDPANCRIISGSYDHSIKVWDAREGESADDGGLKINLEGWTTSWMLSAKSDYRKIVCTSQDGRVVVIDFGFGIEDVELVEAS